MSLSQASILEIPEDEESNTERLPKKSWGAKAMDGIGKTFSSGGGSFKR